MIVPTPRVTPPNLAGILGLAQVVTDQNAVGTATVDGTTYPVNAAGQIVATAQVVGGKIVNNALPNIVAKPAGPTYAIPGSYNPTLSTTPGTQPNVTGGGGYEPVLTPESWLAANVVQPAAGNPTGQYM